jgi:hypothetical protein
MHNDTSHPASVLAISCVKYRIGPRARVLTFLNIRLRRLIRSEFEFKWEVRVVLACIHGPYMEGIELRLIPGICQTAGGTAVASY